MSNLRGLLPGGHRRDGIYTDGEGLIQAFDEEAERTGADIPRAVEVVGQISHHFHEQFRLASEGNEAAADNHGKKLGELTDELDEILGPIANGLEKRDLNWRR